MRCASRLLAFLLSVLLALPAQAGLIRDAEIERDIRDLANPIFESAGLDPASIHILILADPTINAFVAGGANIFLHTGLIEATATPEMLIGVIAHETGHIAGGHLARGAEKIKGAMLGSVLSYVLGAAAMVGGAGQAGQAIMTGGSSIAQRTMLAYTRGNEESADQAGLRFLTNTGMTAQGMVDMFTRLRRDEKQYLGQPDPYALTHPLTTERIATVSAFVDHSPLKDKRYPEAIQERHKRMVAKVEGFIDPPKDVLARHRNDASVAGIYAKAIASYRNSNLDEALKDMNGLLAKEPKNPWFHELKGQMLFENGRIPEARSAYGLAVKYAPNEPLTRTEYAKTLLSGETSPAVISPVIPLLERSSSEDPTYNETWQLLAEAYGRTGNEGKSHLALAENASLNDDLTRMKSESDIAVKKLSPGSPGYIRAQDLRSLAIRLKSEKDGDKINGFTTKSESFSGTPKGILSPFYSDHAGAFAR